jgi:hypothetical protein
MYPSSTKQYTYTVLQHHRRFLSIDAEQNAIELYILLRDQRNLATEQAIEFRHSLFLKILNTTPGLAFQISEVGGIWFAIKRWPRWLLCVNRNASTLRRARQGCAC